MGLYSRAVIVALTACLNKLGPLMLLLKSEPERAAAQSKLSALIVEPRENGSADCAIYEPVE